MTTKKKMTRIGLTVLAFCIALLTLAPFYLIIVNSFKSYKDILLDPVALPHVISFKNFIDVFDKIELLSAFKNSLIITIPSVLLLNLISAFAAHRIARRNTKTMKFLFIMFVASMVVPFQSIMVSIVVISDKLHLHNSYIGLIICYLALGAANDIFLYHGFVKALPRDVEEAALIDGCSPIQSFFRVVMPMMKPIFVTVIILNTLWIWNDFLLPLLIIPDQELQTVPLAINTLFGVYAKRWDLALPALVMAITPIVALFIALQKHIINGITAGSVKG